MEGQGPQYPAGWYANPQGPGERYFDGTNWTDQFRPSGVPAGAPKKERNYMKGCLFTALGVLVGGAVLIGGCVAIIGAGVDEADKEQQKKGISRTEFDSVSQGDAQADVESKLGEPEDSQEFEQNIPELQDKPSKSSCIYYPEKGQPLFEGSSFQLCFDEGKLTSKNVY